MAQTAAPEAAAVAQDESQEVVVTAQRRTERLLDVPVSVAALGEDQIVAMGAQDVGDLANYVPNVAIAEGTGLGSAVFIRGVGSNSRNIGFDSRVGVYLDGVYLGQSANINQQLVDIERVEVLRGPQGALFGKNTVAGAINLITSRPSDAFSAYFNGRVGNYDARTATARINMPLGEGVAAKVSLSRNVRDGFILNLVDGLRGDDVDNWAWRGQLRFQPNDRIELLLSADGLSGDEYGSTGNVLTNTFGTAIDTVAPGRREIAVTRTQTNDRNLWGVSLDGSYRFDSGHALRSQTSYRRTRFRSIIDPDYSPPDILSVDFQDRYRQFTQELQLVSPQGERFEYLVGLYYFHVDASSDRTVRLGPAGGPIFGAPALATLPTLGELTTENYALYANATFDITPQLELGLGFRLSREVKRGDFSIDSTNIPAFGLATGNFAGRHVDEDFSPTATLTYKLTPDLTAYLRYAEGYKSGGFNFDFVTAASFPDGLEFDKETVRNYEAGFRGSLLDGRLRFSLTGFIANYSDYQINQFRDLGGGRSAIVIGNAARVRTKGLELEVQARPARGLTLSGGIGLLDAEYRGLPVTPVLTVNGDLPGASDFQANASIGYETALGDSGLNLRANLTYTYRGPYFSSVENLRSVTVGSPAGPVTIPIDRVRGYDTLDARLAIGGANDRWEVALFGRNITDSLYVIGYERDFFGTLIEGLGDPRTYGLELTLRF
ncbi:MAG TPA: TonB-dependent receptor [Allosphingosinicella sp.]|nr:TonB-dependent receptor [Allosphingosinicella sp.]